MTLEQIIHKYRNGDLVFEVGQIIYTDDNLIVTEQIIEDYIELSEVQARKEAEFWNNWEDHEEIE